jgi:hypothetical protein
MPTITLTVEQLVDAVKQLTPQEWERFEREMAALRRRRLNNGSDTDSLRNKAGYKFPARTQQRLSRLLEKQREEGLSPAERMELDNLLAEYDSHLVEKAEARHALRQRSGKKGGKP